MVQRCCTAQTPRPEGPHVRAHPGGQLLLDRPHADLLRPLLPGRREQRGGAAALLRRAVRHRRGRRDVLRAAVGSQQRALGGAHPTRLRLQRQGVRVAHPPRRGSGPPARLAAQPAAGRGARQALGLRQGRPRARHGARVAAAPRGARAARGGRQAGRGALPVPALVRALARQPRLPALAAGAAARLAPGGGVPRRRLDGRTSPPRGRSRCSRRPAWRTSPSTSRRGSPTARRRWRRPRRRSPSSASTAATPTRGRAAPAPRRTASSTSTATRSSRSGSPGCASWRPGRAAVHVLFNNNYEDWGMQNARRMAHLLGVERRPPQTQLEIS